MDERYKILKIMPSSGDSCVLSAESSEYKKNVCIKLYNRSVGRGKDYKEQYELVKSLQSTYPTFLNVTCKYLDFFEARISREQEETYMCLVMEQVDGQDLFESVFSNLQKYTLRQMCAIARRLLSVLSQLHILSIYHRDIKPENIVVCADGNIKLIDLDYLLHLSEEPREKSTPRISGTPKYMDPLLLLTEKQADIPLKLIYKYADLYSASLTIHFLWVYKMKGKTDTPFVNELTGKRVPLPKIRQAISHCKVHVCNGMPFDIKSVVSKSLALDYSVRASV